MGAQVIAAATNGLPHDDEPQPIVKARTTRDGRTLWYSLRVVQEPLRARACGSGPKSSADRRPVDPPPVVELRIFEGETYVIAKERDITFQHNANFFLYATLEHARVMAQGRLQTPSGNTPPVLTGMPVSGMAYLDRPKLAGYFLFPDLSVRHEGRYKLTFNLYEETKEDKDKDPEDPSCPQDGSPGSFDFRMHIQSHDFVVYSAKKFPGLTESTPLSRTVAEQGCRVRIRRDVRMRRRDGKGNSAGNDYENGEEEYRRARRTATPDTAKQEAYRQRSMSGSTDRTPYSGISDPNRRPSMAEYQPQYSAQTPTPGGHLGFLGPPNTQHQYPTQPQPQSFAQQHSVPPSPVYATSQRAPYQHQPSSYPPPPTPHQPTYQSEHQPSRTYPHINPAPRHDSIHQSTNDYRLPPLSSVAPPSQPPHQQHPPVARSGAPLPPLQVDRFPPHELHPLVSPSPSSMAAPPYPRAYSVSNSGGPSSSGGYPLPPPPPIAGSKRGHDETFRPNPEITRYQNGAREQEPLDRDDQSHIFQYRRADGSFEVKRPDHIRY
ncbi:velvet factor-domain-containing protein [Sordaria brevicollis]|uniref:Velvet factor-domain-containing protein n=1 Tax=Sordaria brevicollis TaxID=83679 RepID=A0AAE0PC77_SORBR|nr:velvet factor-domain-containing protein [Sordaria brevicollis]